MYSVRCGVRYLEIHAKSIFLSLIRVDLEDFHFISIKMVFILPYHVQYCCTIL